MPNLMLMAKYAKSHGFDVLMEKGYIQVAIPFNIPDTGASGIEWHIARTWKQLRNVLGY